MATIYEYLTDIPNGTSSFGKQLESSFSTSATGIITTIPIGAYSDIVNISTLGTSVATVNVEVTTSSQKTILAGGGLWLALTGMTGNTNAVKQGGTNLPITGVRFNVTSAVAGTMSYAIITSCYTGF